MSSTVKTKQKNGRLIPFTNILIQLRQNITYKCLENNSNFTKFVDGLSNTNLIQIINSFKVILPSVQQAFSNKKIEVSKVHIAAYLSFKMLQNINNSNYKHII